MEDMSCQPLMIDPKKYFLSRGEFDASVKKHYPSRSHIYHDPTRSKTAYSAYCGSVHKINMSKGMVAVPAIYADRIQCGIRNSVTATKTVKDSGETVTVLVHRRCSGRITAELNWNRPLENKTETCPSPEEISKDGESLESLICAEMRSTDAPEEFSDNNDFVIWLESCLERFARQCYETRQLLIRCRSFSSGAVVDGNVRDFKATVGAKMSAVWVDTMVAEAPAEVAGKSKRERKQTQKVLEAAKYAQTEKTKSQKRTRGVFGPGKIERPQKKQKTPAAVQEQKQLLATFYGVTIPVASQYSFGSRLIHPTWTQSALSMEEWREEDRQKFKDALQRKSPNVEDVTGPQRHYVLEWFLDTSSDSRQLYSSSAESESDDAPTPLLKNMIAFKSNMKLSEMVEKAREDNAVERDTFCTCRPSKQYKEWVGCENDDCEIVWYHQRCVGLKKKPLKTQVWYCPACRGEDSTQPQGRKGQAGARPHTSAPTRESASVASSD